VASKKFLPYGRQHVTADDIRGVVKVLRSDWLTQGPTVEAFEKALARAVGARHAVACANGTAALHLTALALRLGPGDRAVTSAVTFLATANCARFAGADVLFTDVDPETGLMDPGSLDRLLKNDPERRIKAIFPVHMAGQAADLARIRELAAAHGARVVDDACHALGGAHRAGGKRRRIGDGSDSDMSVFLLSPRRHAARGRGGAVTSPALAERLRLLLIHGMKKEGFTQPEMAFSNGQANPWYYEMDELGYNYRLTDIQAALGLSQLRRLPWSLKRRREIARLYVRLLRSAFPDGGVEPLRLVEGNEHAYHLFVVRVDFPRFKTSRARVMGLLKKEGIDTQVHYIPVPRPIAAARAGPGQFPGAEAATRREPSHVPDLVGWRLRRVVASCVKPGGGSSGSGRSSSARITAWPIQPARRG
jgi:dTDP-4-amino-4,6-dideoxygalactose transaminase